MTRKKIVIVGGVAGGATAAARARRLSEQSEIVVFERGPYVSFANCGLPYFVGGEIADRSKLLLQTPESLKARLNIDVRINTEVISIDPVSRSVTYKNLLTQAEGGESYDDLVLATGATAIRPPILGLDLPGIFTLRTIPDMDAIVDWISAHNPKSAAVVGGGFIGLEMVEQLVSKGISVTLVEALPQVLSPFDPELAALIHAELEAHGVALSLGNPVEAFEPPARNFSAPTIRLRSGRTIPSDLVIFGIGVRPDVALARAAGIAIGPRGGITVTGRLATNVPGIWAVGDCIEVPHLVTGETAPVPLAGPANRQGRIVADNIFGGETAYRGALGTAIVRVLSLTAAVTGANESALRRINRPYKVAHLHPGSHAGYYPGAHPLALKILYSPDDRRLLGAQAVGRDGVDKRIDILATAISAGFTVQQLTDLELCYAPPFGSAKDPVNIAGMIGENTLSGLVNTVSWNEAHPTQLTLDVRSTRERESGAIPGSIHIPLEELRTRLSELPKEQEILVYCASGQRSYFACRILSQSGFRCNNLSGAYKTWSAASRAGTTPT